jgi:filamentous hemagglutinin
MGPHHDRSMLNKLGNGLLLCALMQWSGRASAATPLPVPCVANSCGTNAKGFVSTGSASAVQSGNTLTVNQTTNTATLNWSSFNIGAKGTVSFKQPTSSSIALNKIFDTAPSAIFGNLNANGQVYLINTNGFLFGSGATVNVGGLLASSLNLTDANFAKGILAPGLNGGSALQPVVDSSGNLLSQAITVQAGASLTAADGGRLLLAAPKVTNGGTLTAPDGQVILAAGQTLYLQASSDATLRGLVVEVDGGGTAANQLSGTLSAPRGNVTLTGLMVNQDGRVSATTSVNANGSITLLAADTVAYNTNGFTPQHGGSVELGTDSLTEILPDYSDTTTAVPASTQLQSTIKITGQQVVMHDATIDAPNAALTVTAEANPVTGIQTSDNPNAQIRIDAGTSIDLAGSDAVLPMSANLVSVQLRSNEFADDPTQRGGALQSTPTNTVTVTVDVRADGGKGTPIADVTSAIAAVGQTIAQRTEAGGTAVFQSEGDVVLASGASVNVSGGYTTYLGGTIQTTKLIGANGQIYDIGSANPLLTYTGVINPTFTETNDKFGLQEVIPTPGLSEYESTYVQGASAGGVQFAAPSLLLSGALQATAVSGPYQRSVPPAGGTLTIGLTKPLVTSGSLDDYLSPSVSFANSPSPIVVADGTPLPNVTLQVPTAYLTSDGFTNTTIYSNTSITLPAGEPLQLVSGGSPTSVVFGSTQVPTGASLTLIAPRIDVDSSITAVGGNLSFQNVGTSLAPAPTSIVPATGARQGIEIGDGVTLDVSGQWTNDSTVANGIGVAPTLQNGGAINLQLTAPQSELVIGNDVSLKANGGAWLQSGGALSYGTGGSITLDASPAAAALQLGVNTQVQAFGTGTAQGGSFSLSAPRIAISQGNGSAWTAAQTADDLDASGDVLNLYAPLFSNEGFSSVSLTATGAVDSYATNDVLSVLSGTAITAQTSSLLLTPNYVSAPTGAPVAGITQVNLLPAYQRPATDVTLNVARLADDDLLNNTNFGLLDIQAGASLVVSPGSTLTLSGEGGVTVAGTLRAPGGSIQVSIPAPEIVNPHDTNGITDPGYVSTLGITLAPTAVLDVGGTTLLTPNSQGLLTGTLLPGGSVSLEATRGTVVTYAGSSINIDGSSATLDLAKAGNAGGTTREIVASAGGSLTVSSPDSISLLGNLTGAAGVGNSGAAAAGSLEVDLVRGANSTDENGGVATPQGTLEIQLVESNAGASPSASASNTAILGAQQIAASGIDSLTLKAGGSVTSVGSTPYAGTIEIDATNLALGRQLILEAPSVTVQANNSLSAPFVEIGNAVANVGTGTVVPTPTIGSGTLTVSAQQLTLLGSFAFQGAAGVTLSSAGDVQLEGTIANQATGPTTGSIVTGGSLAIDGLRVYPDTYTDFTLTSLKGSGGTLSIGTTGTSPGTPLSADGSVSVSADNISVTGSLYAPFGTINLTANNTLTLAGGSLVSVSGAGVDIPFGQTELNQGNWIYDTPGAVNQITSVPTKTISLSAPNIAVQTGATANVQGGGDLYAFELVPGTGGSYDNLNASYSNAPSASTAATVSNIPNLYAILPGSKGQAGPYDPQESSQSVAGQSVAGQTIYLSGGAGIAAGFYTLLPARYALEPGAVLIQLEPSYVSASAGQIGALANGTPVIAGYLSVGTTGLHTGGSLEAGLSEAGLTDYQGVAIYPSGYAQKLASYTISNASSYFAAVAASAGTGPVSEPADAGTFNLSVAPAILNSLDLQGNVVTAAASGGRGALVNISAPDLVITAGDATGPAGAVTVSANVLQSWGASTLTLGGAASPVAPSGTDGCASTACSSIAVAANNVTVDAGVQLSADQIVLVAQQSIDVQSGASLLSTSGKNGTVLSTLPSVDTVTLTDTAGNVLSQPALLAVSDLYLPVAARSALNGLAGATIDLQPGATLSSGGALAIDAPGDITLAGTLNGKGASWSLSSSSVAFDGSTASTDTLSITSGLLSSLQQAGAARIESQGTIDIDSPVSLGVSASGSPTLSSLTLIGNSIDNHAAGDSIFGGTSVTLGGISAPDSTVPLAMPTGGTGTLSFVANSLTVGPGVLALDGFEQTTAKVAGAIETRGAGSLSIGGNLTLNADDLTPAPDATDEPGTTIAVTGVLTLGAPSAAAGTTLPTLIGGSLSLSASDIEDGGKIVAPSGIVELNSTGTLHLTPTASIDASGATVTAVDQTASSPGGLVMLSAAGNLTLDAGSSIAVAGSASAPAGTLNMTGSGTVTVAGALNGAGNGNTGGSLSIAAGALAGGFASLVANPGLAGFTNSLSLRTHTGDLDLANSSSVTANQIVLTADTGTVDIAGVLSAPSASQRGVIDLSGGVGVTLASSAQLHADGSGSGGLGGEIDINSVSSTCGAVTCTSTGSITLDTGSVVSTYGAAQMGELVLRAPAVATNAVVINDVAINTGASGLGADVSRVGQVIIEPVLVSPTSSATVNSDLPNAVAAAAGFLGAAGQGISARLTSSRTTPLSVQAGVELQDTNSGDTLVLPALDLSQNSTQGQVVNLTVRAAGGLSINGVISDGFNPSTTVGTTLTDMPSGSLSFVAGADLSSANPLATLSAATNANLTLAPTGIVRTGTGDIDLAAAGDIVFQYGSAGGGASVYTAGVDGATAVSQGRGKGLENFPTKGGNIQVLAGGDVVGAALDLVNPDSGNYGVTGWQPRGTTAVVGSNPAVSVGNYGVNFDNFHWNLGALGGGDVTVAAGGAVMNVSAATADSSPDGNTTIYGAGGGLRIAAVGDIGSAQLYVADGTGKITTNAGLTSLSKDTNGDSVGSSFALGNAQISVWARQSVLVNAIYNPTVAPVGPGVTGKSATFFTYGSDSALNLSSTDGDVTLNLSASGSEPLGVLLGSQIPAESGGAQLVDLPPNLAVQALQQDIVYSGSASLFPSSTGQLRLFAGQDIDDDLSTINMSDAAAMPTAANTAVAFTTTSNQFGGLVTFQGVIHTGDTQPALITAGRDINDLFLDIPKTAQIAAGRDIVNLGYQGQNIATADNTLITAGRDITYTGSSGYIEVGGPGSLDVFAGRNINLGISNGIFTTGDLANANLPTPTGADLTLAVGYGTTGADNASFVTGIIAPSPTYQAELVSYVESLTGDTALTFAQAQTAFAQLTLSQQTALVDDVFFNELLLSGRAANSGSGVGFTEGYAAIDALFPNSRNPTAVNPNPYGGNLDLTSSQIYTLSGGNISLLVPGGAIDVGLAFTPVGLNQKDPGHLGIVAEGAGNIDIYAQGDVNVNASRVFTLGGGNILIWSDEGNIDAGNGSKSSLSAPPPTVTVASNGNVTINYSGSLTGSGIRTIQTDPSVPAGDVDLDAPVGTVNAGDAGIGAAGNINIAAAHVIGALNINFGGTATGVPSDLSGLSASLSGASNAGTGATNSSTNSVSESPAQQEAAPIAQSALSWLEVFVTGLGEENCKQDDLECLKRQKSAAP